MRKTTARVLGVALFAAGCGDAQQDAVPAAPAEQRATPSAEDRYLRAVSLLEIERKPAEARTAFEALASDESASDTVRARARIGLARAERLLGDPKSADANLRRVAERPAETPAAAAAARAQLSAAAGASTRFATGLAELGEGQYLDLDTGGMFSAVETPLGGRADVARRGDEFDWIADRADAPEMDGVLPWIADAPWSRVTTDAGRTAWVQRLPGPRPAAFRFVVRLSGAGAAMAAPRNPFCVGRDRAIDVHFTADPRYARYRIERRPGADGAFQARCEIAAPPFADTGVSALERYGYRITGIAANGDEGIPALVAGTTRSRGVTTGSVDLVAGGRDPVWFDFSAESVGATGDLKFQTSYGGGDAVGFLDASGRIVNAVREGERPRTVWAASSRRDWPREVRTGDWIVVPIRGGGVARCRVTAGPSWHAHLDYEVDPDGDAFAAGLELTAEERTSDAVIRVVPSPAEFVVRQVLARDPRKDEPAAALPVTDGFATDPAGGPGSLREYTAVGEDQFGRRSVPGSLTINRLASEPREGTFEFHYQQGWSFERDCLVDAADADIVFARSAGGTSSITLNAPGGIVSLDDALGQPRSTPSAGRLFDMLLSADETGLKLKSEARCDSRTASSDVAVLRTRHGGWAKVAIVERGKSSKGWTENPATIRYVYNPGAPQFATSDEPVDEAGGLRLIAGAIPGDRVPPGLKGEASGPKPTSAVPGAVRLFGDRTKLTEAAAKTLDALTLQKIGAAIGRQPLANVLPTLAQMLRVPVKFEAAALATAGSAEVELAGSEVTTVAEYLDSLMRQAGLAWTIDDEGTVWIMSRPK